MRAGGRTGLYILYVAALSGLMLHLVTHRHSDPAVVWIMTGVMAGGTLMMSVYGFSLYRTRPKERALLFFAGYCLAASVRMLFLQNGPGPMLFPALSERAVLTLRALGTLGSGAFHFNFIFELFGENRSPKLRQAVNGWMLAVGAVALALRLAGSPAADLVSLAAGIPMLVLNGALIAISGKLKKNPVNWIFFVTTVIDIFSFLLVMLRIPGLAIVWNFAYTISITFFMADRYAHAMNAVETVNETLEETVAQRTGALRLVNESLSASQAALREMLVSVSHDLRTPLTALNNSLELLGDEQAALTGAEQEEYYRVAYQKNLDMQQLVKDLFEAARTERGASPSPLQWIGADGLARQMEEKYQKQAGTAGIAFTTQVESGFEVQVDGARIWSVLDNLVYNALRHTPNGGGVTVTAGLEEDRAVFRVQDTGEGIGPEHLPHLFERFYKVSHSRGEKDGSGGLGLYIVKTAAEAMGGAAAIESELGQGTTVTVTLPGRAAEEAV